jgi:hypothetical protein
VCGNNVTTMSYTYYGCQNLAANSSMYCYNPNINDFQSCFGLKNNSRRINVHVPAGSTTNTVASYNNTNSIVGKNITWTTNTSNKCYYNTAYNIYIYYDL